MPVTWTFGPPERNLFGVDGFRRSCQRHRHNRANRNHVPTTNERVSQTGSAIDDWCTSDEHTRLGGRVRYSFPHDEIAEHIGLSRRTSPGTLLISRIKVWSCSAVRF